MLFLFVSSSIAAINFNTDRGELVTEGAPSQIIEDDPQSSFSANLTMNQYAPVYAEAEGLDQLYWEFAGSLSNIGITVRVMDSIQYLKFTNLESYIYYPLSDGSYYIDSGTFTVPYYDIKWYVVFINWDADNLQTLLSYNVSLISNSFGGVRADYDDWIEYNYSGLEIGGSVDWEFEGSNPYVGISVYAMNASNYWNFEHFITYDAYILSAGAFTLHNGTFTIPYADDWYILFLNFDDDEEPTDIVSSVNYHPPNYIEITHPEMGESWTPGNAYEIHYDYRNVDYVNTYLYNDGVNVSTLASDIAATGIIYWTIPDTLSSGDLYQIVIEDAYDLSVYDYGDYFTIDDPGELAFGEYLYYNYSAAGNDILNWEYTSSNINIGARVYALDALNFGYFEVDDPSYKWVLADTESSSDSGSFTIPYTDTWYLVYINLDTDEETTILETDQTLTLGNFGGERIDYFAWAQSNFPESLEANTQIVWEFEGTNPWIGIRVYAFNSAEYANWEASEQGSYYVLADGTDTEDSGVFIVPYTDIWHFVFINYDTDMQPTDVVREITQPETSLDDIYEENDSPSYASELDAGNYTNLACLDADWYSVNLTEGDTIKISLSFTHSEGNISLYLFDASQTLINSSTSASDNEFLEYLVSTAGIYYILVECLEQNLHYAMEIVITPSETDPTDDSTPTDDGFDFSSIPSYPLGSLFFIGTVALVVMLQRKRKLS